MLEVHLKFVTPNRVKDFEINKAFIETSIGNLNSFVVQYHAIQVCKGRQIASDHVSQVVTSSKYWQLVFIEVDINFFVQWTPIDLHMIIMHFKIFLFIYLL